MITDCIHHFIHVPPTCQKIIDTPEFQRLRRIKQLGLCYYIYPNANHTRFEHSLGVMHLAGKLFSILTKQYPKYKPFKILVQTAGLLHDIGHIAFSHLFDDILELKHEQENQTNIQSSKHEDRSIVIFKQINQRLQLFTPHEEYLIECMIKGQYDPHYPRFMFQIVCNSENGVDVDKMDYLSRDAYHTGMPVSQSDYIIYNTILDKNFNITFPDKIQSEIKQLLETRKRMFHNIYYHKTVIKLETIFYCMLNDYRDDLMNIDTLKPETYLYIDDVFVEFYIRYVREHPFIKDIDERKFTHICDKCKSYYFMERT